MKTNLLLFSAVTFLFSCSTQKDIDIEKYPIVTTIQELANYYDLNIDTTGTYETRNSIKYFDGSCELEYSYELIDSEEYDALFYSLTFSKEASVKDAKQSFALNKGSLQLIGNSFEQGTIEIDSLTLPGDESYYAFRTYNGATNGMFYITRKGRRICTMVLSGLYTPDHSLINNLIIPKNKNLKNFDLIKNQ